MSILVSFEPFLLMDIFWGTPCIIRSIRHKKLLFLKYVYRQEIPMRKSQISIIPSLKAGAHCWEADVNRAKLRNLSLILRPPEVGSGARA